MEKIYGIYHGNFDTNALEKMHEIDIWKKIDSLGEGIFWINHDACDRRIELSEKEWEKVEEAQYLLEYLIYYTKKFGVKFDREPVAGQHVENSADYVKWYNFWNNHVNSWSKEQLNEFIKRRKNNQDFSDFLPKTSWNENRQKEKAVEREI